QAMHCWVWPNLIFWSIIPEHASRHSAPLFPGIAGLAAMVWVVLLTGKLQRARRPGWIESSGPTMLLSSRHAPREGALPHAEREGYSPTVGLEDSTDPTPNRWRIGLVSLVVMWLITKLVFVHVIIPQRNPARAPQAKGEQLAALVPPGKTLY